MGKFNLNEGNESLNRILLMMKYDNKKTLSENTSVSFEDDVIQHNTNEVIIKEFLSPDEKYVIFLDELYDIENKKHLGNVWENFNNLTLFLRHSFQKSNLDKTIKENALKTLNSNLLTESSEDILKLKGEIKQYINEQVWDDFKDWAKETGQSAVSGFKEFISKTKKGASDLVDKVSNSQWADVLDLLKKGIYYFAKKLRDAMYHPVGLVLDAILVASGIGKSVQWIPWAIIVGLDIYELINGDYESLTVHLLNTLFDVIGLVVTGSVAAGLRLTFKGIKSAKGIKKAISSNPTVKKYISNLPKLLSKISPKLQSAINYLSSKFPKAADFLKDVMGMVDKFINKMITEFNKLLKPSVAVSGGVATAVTSGMDIYAKNAEKASPNADDDFSSFTEKDIDKMLNTQYNFDEILGY